MLWATRKSSTEELDRAARPYLIAHLGSWWKAINRSRKSTKKSATKYTKTVPGELQFTKRYSQTWNRTCLDSIKVLSEKMNHPLIRLVKNWMCRSHEGEDNNMELGLVESRSSIVGHSCRQRNHWARDLQTPSYIAREAKRPKNELWRKPWALQMFAGASKGPSISFPNPFPKLAIAAAELDGGNWLYNRRPLAVGLGAGRHHNSKDAQPSWLSTSFILHKRSWNQDISQDLAQRQ